MRSIILSILMFLLAASCSRSTDSLENGEVSLYTESNKLFIHNGTIHKVYYFAVDIEVAAIIDWSAGLKNYPSIVPGKSKSIAYNDFPFVPVKKGDRIIVYWWSKYDYENREMNFEDIDL